MRFWDSSAIVPMLHTQPATGQVRALLEQDEHMVVWWGSAVECASALARLRREQSITLNGEDMGLNALTVLQSTWFEITPADELRRTARRLLRVHPLRAADAMQLAAALTWFVPYGEGEFVSLDQRLNNAARLEGFDVVLE